MKRALGGCLACLVGLATLALLTYRGGSIGRLDARAVRWLSSFEGTWVRSLAEYFHQLGNPLPQVPLLAVACLIALRRGQPRRAIAATTLVGGANLATQLLKLALSHPRYQPLLGYWHINPSSFPSGHSTAAMSMALAYLLVVPDNWRAAVIGLGVPLVLAVSCSVVVLRYHYPSDVLGGWLVAGAWFFAVVACLRSSRSEPDGVPEAEAGRPSDR